MRGNAVDDKMLFSRSENFFISIRYQFHMNRLNKSVYYQILEFHSKEGGKMTSLLLERTRLLLL